MVLAALTDTIFTHNVFSYFRLNQQYLKKKNKASFEATQGSENRIMGGLFPPQFPYISCFHSQAAQISDSADLMSKTHNSELDGVRTSALNQRSFVCFRLFYVEKQARQTPPAAPSLIKMKRFLFLRRCSQASPPGRIHSEGPT